MVLWKKLVIIGFAINFLIPVLLWTSGDYEGKVIYIPQHVESEPTTLQPQEFLELTYYVEEGKLMGLSSVGSWEKVSRDMFAIEKLKFKITNQENQEEELEKLMVNECNYPATMGVAFGCYRVLESANYTFTVINDSGFDLDIPTMQFGIFDNELITEFDETMDEGDILPIFGYQVLVAISVILIVSGFVLRYHQKK